MNWAGDPNVLAESFLVLEFFLGPFGVKGRWGFLLCFFKAIFGGFSFFSVQATFLLSPLIIVAKDTLFGLFSAKKLFVWFLV